MGATPVQSPDKAAAVALRAHTYAHTHTHTTRNHKLRINTDTAQQTHEHTTHTCTHSSTHTYIDTYTHIDTHVDTHRTAHPLASDMTNLAPTDPPGVEANATNHGDRESPENIKGMFLVEELAREALHLCDGWVGRRGGRFVCVYV